MVSQWRKSMFWECVCAYGGYAYISIGVLMHRLQNLPFRTSGTLKQWPLVVSHSLLWSSWQYFYVFSKNFCTISFSIVASLRYLTLSFLRISESSDYPDSWIIIARCLGWRKEALSPTQICVSLVLTVPTVIDSEKVFFCWYCCWSYY